MTEQPKEEFKDLTDDCGHHCGKVTTGGKVKHVGHCESCHLSNDKSVCVKDNRPYSRATNGVVP